MAKCPHCSYTIELMAQKDICEAYGISQSAITQRRAKGEFPEPWDTQGGRLLWLRSDMDLFFHNRAEQMIARRIDDLEKILGRVPEGEKTAVLAKLQDMLTTEAVEPKPAPQRRSRAKV